MIAISLNTISQKKHGAYNAVDYRAKDPQNNWRKEIYAPEDGEITAYLADGTSVGKQIQMTTPAGRHGFAHTESMSVKVGDNVKKGQLIGIMGWTGLVDPPNVNGTHCHWTFRRNDGVYIYPPDMINEDINNFIGGTMPPISQQKIDPTSAQLLSQQLYGTTPATQKDFDWICKQTLEQYLRWVAQDPTHQKIMYKGLAPDGAAPRVVVDGVPYTPTKPSK